MLNTKAKPILLLIILAILKNFEYNPVWRNWQTLFIDVGGLDPAVYCSCGNCTKKPSLAESVCCLCHSTEQNPEDQGCIVNSEFVSMILHRVMLEVSLRNIWNLDWNMIKDKTLSNKWVYFLRNIRNTFNSFRNFRYASYRNLYFFLFKSHSKKKSYRVALPSCLVDKVRKEYPEDSADKYVGFKMWLYSARIYVLMTINIP